MLIMISNPIRYQLHTHHLRDYLASQLNDQLVGHVWCQLHYQIWDHICVCTVNMMDEHDQLDEDHAGY